MVGDLNKPTVFSLYIGYSDEIRANFADQAKMFDGIGIANLPSNTIRWNSTNKRLELWNGSAWVELIPKATDKYDINVDRVDGCDVGTGANNILQLDGSGKVPSSAIPTSTLEGLMWRKTNLQSIPSGSWTAVSWNNEVYDTLGLTPGTGITIPAGWSKAIITAQSSWAEGGTSGTKRGIKIEVPSFPNALDMRAPIGVCGASITTGIIPVTPGEIFYVFVFQNTGSPINFGADENGDAIYPFVSIRRIE